MLMYLLRVRPFEDPFLNRLEIFNECCVLASTYHLYLYSDFLNDDISLQYSIGWSMIYVTLFNIGANILVVVICTL